MTKKQTFRDRLLTAREKYRVKFFDPTEVDCWLTGGTKGFNEYQAQTRYKRFMR